MYEEEDDAPRRPIFNPKKKQGKVKKCKKTPRHRRSLRLPVEGNPPPAYTPSPSAPSSPGSMMRVLENIPEEIEEIREDIEEEGDDENRPMLNRNNSSGHHVVTINIVRGNIPFHICSAFTANSVISCRQYLIS